jgi:multidrug efflux pump subunit AcrB
VVAFAVLFSLLVARLITPLLSGLLHARIGPRRRGVAHAAAYTHVVRWSVSHHYKSVALGIGIFACSIGSFYLLPRRLPAAEDSSRTLLAIELPPGSLMEETRAVTDAIVGQLRDRPEVKSVFVNGGRVLGSGAEVRKATLIINIVPKEKRKLTQDQVRDEIGRSLAGVPDIASGS